MKTFLLLTVSALISGKPARDEDMSLAAKPLLDVTSSSAPVYWSAECGGQTYVGSYTLMMDWAQCKDYCNYFPHAAELGHTFSFADILDADTMECLRYNMESQYTPGNGYDGHYWAGGYRGGDGLYRWDSGVAFEFNDFVRNPGEDPYIHLTPGNNYQWNTKNDQNDRNNGCLCKSNEPTSEAERKGSDCPSGWFLIGLKCLRWTLSQRLGWYDAHDYCQEHDAELVSWRDYGEFLPLSFFMREMGQDYTDLEIVSWTGAINDNKWSDWTWGNNTDDLVPMNFGWLPNEPSGPGMQCGEITPRGLLNDHVCDRVYPETGNDRHLPFFCQAL